MNVPLLSVVIPVFNVKAYLPELFASLQETRRRDVEIILVDDAGQDGSWTWIEDWGIPLLEGFFVKCIRHERNLGLSAARNSGLGAATGRYVLFLDSDDVLEAGALDVIATEIESSAKDLYFLDFDFLSTEHCTFRRPLRAGDTPGAASGGLLGPLEVMELQTKWEGSRRYERMSIPDVRAVFDDFLRYTIFYAWSLVIRREVLAGLRFITGVYFEDAQFTILVTLSAQSLGILANQPLLLYRQRTGSIMSRMAPKKIADLTQAITPVYAHPLWQNLTDEDLRLAILALDLQYQVWAVKDFNDLDLPNGQLRARIEDAIRDLRARIQDRRGILRLFMETRAPRDLVYAWLILNAPTPWVFTLAKWSSSPIGLWVWRRIKTIRGRRRVREAEVG